MPKHLDVVSPRAVALVLCVFGSMHAAEIRAARFPGPALFRPAEAWPVRLLTADSPSPAQIRREAPAPTGAPFEFRVGLWTSLHHQLHAQARPRPAPSPTWPDDLAVEARDGWARALTHYRTLGRRSLLFDDGLVQVGDRLRTTPDDETPGAETLLADTRSALLDARAAYEAALWPALRASATAFTARVSPLLGRHGPSLARAVAAAYGATWPAQPIPVDLVGDAGPPGNAYTISTPGRITVAVADPRHQGLAALEILFHEASHLWDATLQEGLRAAARDQGRVVPPDLWHAVLFFTAGELTRRELARAGMSYTPYAEAQGMTTGVYRAVWPAIVTTWTPYLDGRQSLSASLIALVRAVGRLPPG